MSTDALHNDLVSDLLMQIDMLDAKTQRCIAEFAQAASERKSYSDAEILELVLQREVEHQSNPQPGMTLDEFRTRYGIKS